MKNKFKKTNFSRCIVALAIIIALLSLTSGSILVSGQIGVPQPTESAGYISVAPTVIGVGQTATVNLWVFPLPTNYLYGTYYGGYTGITVTFLKPDGTDDTLMPVDGTGQFDPGQTQALGAIYFFYEPDMAGEWSVTMSMPEQNITDATGTVILEACTSEPAYFTVTEDPQYAGLICGYPWAELPNENTYWDYPISSNNREWSQISGDWLQGRTSFYAFAYQSFSGVTARNWQPYADGPNTGHILWEQPLRTGGLIGGEYGSLSYYLPDYSGGVVIQGKLIRNIPNGQFECIDLTSGEVLYTVSGSISCGIHLPGNALAQNYLDDSVVLSSSMGNYITPYLFTIAGTTWNYYDPFDGTLKKSFSDAGAGFKLVDGTNLAFGLLNGNLTAWDMSTVVGSDWSTGITWETPLPVSNRGTFPSLLAISTCAETLLLTTYNEYWGYSAEDGTLLWHFTLDYPISANVAVNTYGVDKFLIYDYVDATFHCHSMITGDELWESDSYADSPWATTWTVYTSETNDYENVYLALPDGTVSALSLETGHEVWRSEPIASTEYTNNAVPYVQGILMSGENIYVYGGYSIGYLIDPIPRFARLVCIDATTGDIKYTLNGAVYPEAAANGYVIGTSLYDGNIYCIGKGQTSTSVIIQDDVVTDQETVLIHGNVLDESPAQAGTPAVSDSSMSEWMDYLHMQNSTLLNNPPTPEGVAVQLTAIDPNNNLITIGTTTTEASGNFYFEWNPPSEITGMYKITATFAGSDSYWSSDSETAVIVTEAPLPSTSIEPEEPVETPEEPVEPTEAVETPFITTEVAIIAAIAVAAVIGVAAYVLLKRK